MAPMMGMMPGGEMRFITGDGNSFQIGANGQVSSVADSLTSQCGSDFDEYVRRALQEPFPYSSSCFAFRKVTDLWAERRARIFMNGNWREAKVQSWRQSNCGPFDRTTSWSLDLVCETFENNDVVVVDGLKSAKKYNGKEGKILKYVEEQGRYKVKLIDVKAVIGVKPENTKAKILSFKVNRMNIEGGCTLVPFSGDQQSLISLEWLEPASPSIDLDEGALKANCPKCRAVEPPMAAYDNAPNQVESECPICLETKECRSLQCKHSVCDDCWKRWRNASTSVPVPRPEMDPDVLQQERARRQQEAFAILPPELGGTGWTPDDTEEVIKKAEEKYSKFLNDQNDALLDASGQGEEGLSRFWKELMVMSMAVLSLDEFWVRLMENLSIAPLEIIMNVMEERKDDLYDGFHLTANCSDIECEGRYENHCSCVCNYIGEKYDDVRNYRGAIPWYERSLLHATNWSQLDTGSHDEACQTAKARQHTNLGLAQKRAGRLRLALENYNASLGVDGAAAKDTSKARNNRTKILREMEAWTGSSGNLTPGC